MALTAKEKRDQRAAEKAAAIELEKLNVAQFTDPGASPEAHGEVVRGPQRGRTVTVACKLGIAWFSMQLCKIEDKFEQNMQGGRTVKEATRIGPVVRIRGTAYPRGTPPEGFPPAPIIVDGAALNFGIDAEFWETWVAQNHLNPLVVNHMVFAHEKEDHVRKFAKEQKENLSGLDPINPKGDVRNPRSSRRGEVTEIEPGKRQVDA